MNNRRSTILINKSFQINFLKRAFCFLSFIFGAIVLANIWLLSPLLDYIQAMNLPQGDELLLIVEDFKNYGLLVMGLLFISLTAFFTMASLLITHRIAGPLYNLENALEKMISNKKLEKVHFRQGDYFQNIQNQFNSFVENFQDEDDQLKRNEKKAS